MIIKQEHRSEIHLTQIHVAATMRKKGQIVVADHERLGIFVGTNKLRKYDRFGQIGHGNFTA